MRYQRAASNKAANLMYGVGLHAASRFAAGKPLSQFEEGLLTSFRIMATDAEIKDYGRMFDQAKAQGRHGSSPNAIVPEQVFNLPDAPYTRDDYLRDIRALAPEIASQDNIETVDLSKTGGQYTGNPEIARRQYEAGFGAARFTASGRKRDSVRTNAEEYVAIKMLNFRCIKSSGDVWLGPRDEIYWCWGAASDGGHKTSHRTGQFGSIEDGSKRNFPDPTLLFEGSVRDSVEAHVEVWEEDDSGHGFEDKLRQTMADIAQKCFETAVDIMDSSTESQKAAAIVALIGAVAGFVSLLIGWFQNEDDLVKQLTFSWDVDAIRTILDDWSLPQLGIIFDGGSVGKHELTLWFTR
jgi:hypothetical protein